MTTYISLICIAISAVYDIRYRRIPNATVIILFLTAIYSMTVGEGDFASRILGFFIPSVLFFIPYSFGKTGAGDIKLFSATGLFMGLSSNILLFLMSSLSALIFSGAVYIINRKKISSLPYAPFVLFSFIVLLIFGKFFN